MKDAIARAKRGMWLAAVALLAAPTLALAQQPAGAAAPKAVALVPDACPAVQPGGRIALDWNPIFDPSWEASGLFSFHLFFSELDEYGVNVMDQGPRFVASTQRTPGAISDVGNGFYHIELTIPRNAHAGTFRLVGALARAELDPGYKDGMPWPSMTNSPVQARFCVTVVRVAENQPATEGQPAMGGN